MNISEKAKKLYQDAIVIEGQLAFEQAMPLSLIEKFKLVDEYKDAGFTAVTLSLANEETSTEQALHYLAKIRKHIFKNDDKYILARTKNDILDAKKNNKIALRLMFQGTEPIAKNLDLLETFQTLGISSLLLAYNIRTPMGDGVIEENDAGVSLLGKAFIVEANRLGIILDGSHAGFNTSMQALQLTTSPMAFSHSGVYGVAAHIRNVRDEQIYAVAKTGGVIGVNGLGLLLGDKNARVEKYIEHIDYIYRLVGDKHIAMGLDNLFFAAQFSEFMDNQSITHPPAYANQVGNAMDWKYIKANNMLEIVEGLLQSNYSEAAVKGFLGENILRIMKD